jgi:hypothetical protein
VKPFGWLTPVPVTKAAPSARANSVPTESASQASALKNDVVEHHLRRLRVGVELAHRRVDVREVGVLVEVREAVSPTQPELVPRVSTSLW